MGGEEDGMLTEEKSILLSFLDILLKKGEPKSSGTCSLPVTSGLYREPYG
jgi:hypothetical protein